MIYLESAAVVKLAHAEPESAALRRWLDERAETGWISSVLTEIEAFRALARYAPAAEPTHCPYTGLQVCSWLWYWSSCLVRVVWACCPACSGRCAASAARRWGPRAGSQGPGAPGRDLLQVQTL